MTRVAVAALLTLPGIPTLFTGQERGAEYEPYGQDRALGRDDPHQLRPYHRALIDLRHTLPALRSDRYGRLELATPDTRVLAFERGGAAVGADSAIVVLRFDGSSARSRVVLPAWQTSREWRDALSGDSVRANAGVLEVELAPWSARVLVPSG